MARADTEQEAVRVLRGDPMVGAGRLIGRDLPDVHDPGGHDQVLGRVEQRLDLVQVGRGHVAEPQRAVAQLLELGGQLGRRRVVPPHTDGTQGDLVCEGCHAVHDAAQFDVSQMSTVIETKSPARTLGSAVPKGLNA